MDFDLNFSDKYRKTQVNGTIYVTTLLPVTAEQQNTLDCGANELFLKSIHKTCSVESVLQIAIELGEVYMLRFKVDFSSNCRGYAFLQYIDPQVKKRALEELQLRFKRAKHKIQVQESKDRKHLYLKKVNHLTPLQVYQELRKLHPFTKLIVYEYEPFNYAYIIIYRNNDHAAMAHHTLRTKVSCFGAGAFIAWLDKFKKINKNFVANCCVQLPRSENVAQLQQQLQQVANDKTVCLCFRI